MHLDAITQLFPKWWLILCLIHFCLSQSTFPGDGLRVKKLELEAEECIQKKVPRDLVLTTWEFYNATKAAYEFLSNEGATALDAVVEGCSVCEREQCDYTVGYGGSPDESGETTLDAMVFDGDKLDVGAVGGLKRIKNAIGVARAVLDHAYHSILVGDAATKFAIAMGFKEESLSTNRSIDQWKNWSHNNCQPNFWKNVVPDSLVSCGPYKPDKSIFSHNTNHLNLSPVSKHHHDTIGQIVMDSSGLIVTGTSSNGALHKIPGRMGDAAVPGAGGYADKRFGACVSTGDGDIMMRFSSALQVVERMKSNTSPGKATRQVIDLIRNKYPEFKGAVLAVNVNGQFSAACNGLTLFPFTVASSEVNNGTVKRYYVYCLDFLEKRKKKKNVTSKEVIERKKPKCHKLNAKNYLKIFNIKDYKKIMRTPGS